MKYTVEDLDLAAHQCNTATGMPTERFDEDGQENPGHFYISGAYGGWCLARTGGRFPLGQNHVSKREAYHRIQAFLKGIYIGRPLPSRGWHRPQSAKANDWLKYTAHA